MIYKVEENCLTIHNVKKVYGLVIRCIEKREPVDVDLTAVDYIDTAGIALVLSWWQYAVNHDVICYFKTSATVRDAIRGYQIELP